MQSAIASRCAGFLGLLLVATSGAAPGIPLDGASPVTIVNPPVGAAAEEGRDASPGEAPSTRLGIDGSRFTVNGKPTFLAGVSYYGALGAADETLDRDLDDMARRGANWIRVWATWAAFGKDVSAVDGDGSPRQERLDKLRSLVLRCDRRGMVVDVSLSRGNGISGPPRLGNLDAHRRAVEAVAAALRSHRNWYLDLSNERNIEDRRFTSFPDLKALRQAAREVTPDLLVTASHSGDIDRETLSRYLLDVRVDFITPHRHREPPSPAETESRTREYLEWMREAGRIVPVHYQEPFRRGHGAWAPGASDFETDLRGALSGGAAGWCFHNGDTRDAPDGTPRRSFDLSGRRLFETLDSAELKFLDSMRGILPAVPAAPKGG